MIFGTISGPRKLQGSAMNEFIAFFEFAPSILGTAESQLKQQESHDERHFGRHSGRWQR